MKQLSQAILMAAGPGSRMSTVGYHTKCLLPIGNYPMIYFPLQFLQKMGYQEVTVVVRTEDERSVLKLSELFGLKIRLDIATVNTSDDPGTAESLRRIEHKIRKNVEEIVILSCDMITDFNLQPMMDQHLSKGAALTMLTAAQQHNFMHAAAPGPKSKNTISNDILCKEEKSDRLVYSVAGGDYDETVKLPSKVISQVDGPIELSLELIDGHLYIMKRWLIDYIIHKNSPCFRLGSLKAEVVPHIISEQFSKNDPKKYTIHKAIKSNRYENLIKKYNTSVVSSRFHSNTSLDARVCYSYYHPGFLVRINTIGNLWQINQQVNDLYDKLEIQKIDSQNNSPEEISPKSQICEQTIIGRSTQIAAKTNITKCVIGNHCRIQSFVRLVDSVLFDYVNVAEGCIIENSLICVNVDFKCTIKNSILADPTKIEANKIYENELLERSQVYAD